MGINYSIKKCLGKKVVVTTTGGEVIEGIMLDSGQALQMMSRVMGSEFVIAMSDGVFVARPDVKKVSYVANEEVQYIDLLA